MLNNFISLSLILALSCFSTVHSIQFQPHIANNDGLLVDGSYSKMTTLTTRLPFVSIPLHAMTKRHLWMHMSILTLALDSLNFDATLVPIKFKLTRAIRRLQYMTFPDMRYDILEEGFNYQIDHAMLVNVQTNLRAILIPPQFMKETDDLQIVSICMQERQTGTTAMLRCLFQAWDIMIEDHAIIIQLLARCYLPHLYILHMTHDGDYLYHQNLFEEVYNDVHQRLAPFHKFQLLGNAHQYELALTLVDSLDEKNDCKV